MKKGLLCFLTVLMALFLTTTVVLAEETTGENTSNSPEIVDSGSCGENVTWELDSEGKLTISGTGEMYNYQASPEFSSFSSIKKAIITDGVTSIGNNAFLSCSNLISIEIPNSVTSIGDRSFYNCTRLKSIYIPKSVTSIGKYAIDGSITIYCEAGYKPSGWDSNWVSSADGIYYSFTKIDYEFWKNVNTDLSKNVSNFIIPNGVTLIPHDWFYNCSNLISIEIPDSVTKIGSFAFDKCTNLKSIEIPDSVTSIGTGAFYRCSSLKSIYIPNSVTWMGAEVFNGDITIFCESDEEKEQWDPGWTSSGGTMIDARYSCAKNDYEFWRDADTNVSSFIIPNGVTSIPSWSFKNCSSLISIDIPDSVIKIGSNAFNNCSSLTSIDIPNGVTTINSGVFCECISLSSIDIPNSVTKICDNAFSNCSSLISVCIPDSVTDIGDFAFCDCQETNFYIPESVINIGRFAFYGNVYCESSSEKSGWDPDWLYGSACFAYNKNDFCFWIVDFDSNISNLVIPDGVTSIPNHSFENCSSLTSIDIPDSVTEIGICAFENCSNLTSIDIPNSVTKIGSNAFNNCSSLKRISISDRITRIEAGTFSGCHNLADVEIPYNVTTIDSNAFENCTSLKHIYISKNVTRIFSSAFNGDITIYCESSERQSGWAPDWTSSVNDVKYSCPGNDYRFWKSADTDVSSFIIPNGVTSIPSYSFKNCSNLTSVDIPNSVTKIGSNAFENCTSLKHIYIPKSITSIFSGAFNGDIAIYCESSESQSGWASDWTSSAKDVKYSFTKTDYEFWKDANTKVSNFIIPNGVTLIPSDSFKNCSSLTSIEIPDSVKTICEDAFSGYNSLTTIEIPNSVTSIGCAALSGCRKLASITLPFVGDSRKGNYGSFYYIFGNSSAIPPSLNTIKLTDAPIICTKAFSGCTNLIRIEIPNSVTYISSNAFENCTSLKSICIPNSVVYIYSGAFAGCTNLTRIEIPNSVTYIGSNAFENCVNLKSIYIPKSVAKMGEGVFYGCSNAYVYTWERGTPPSWDSNWSSGCKHVTRDFSKENYDLWKDVDLLASEPVIPNGVTYIPDKLFSNFSSLKSITIPNSVTSIGDSAFENCRNLTSITIRNSVTYIGSNAFENCVNLKSIYIPKSVTSIGKYAIDGSITIYCEAGYKPSGWDSNWVSTADGIYYSFTKIDYEFWKNVNTDLSKNVSNFIIPNGVTLIPHDWFYNCSNLISIEIPDSVTSIGDSAFENCRNLTSITIPNSVTNIGNSAFYECSSLKSLRIPDSVSSIGNNAFGRISGIISYSCNNVLLDDEIIQCHSGSLLNWEKIHSSLKTDTINATTTKDGTINKCCQTCGYIFSSTVIPQVTSMGLFPAVYTYTGGVKTPAVTVKDAKGKTLTNKTDYTVKYASGRKTVGTYKVTINLKGNYSGSRTLSFKIIPKGTYISSLTRGTKAFTVKWKKQSTQTSGYQILYSTSSKFTSGNKYVTVTSNKTTAKKITKLKSKKKYYVKIRTYKTVNGTRYYSGWSSVKSVTTK